jgi:hypothetical protein
MFQVEINGRVRRAVRVEGRSQRAVAREFGLSREKVHKMLQFAVPPSYQREQPIKRSKLDPWLGVIDAILKDDKQRPAKQRHTAKRIFDRLKEEHQFTGGYTIVKDYVRSATLQPLSTGSQKAIGRCFGGTIRVQCIDGVALTTWPILFAIYQSRADVDEVAVINLAGGLE